MGNWSEIPRRMFDKSAEHRTLLSRLVGMIAPEPDATPDELPPAPQIRVIPGGPAAPELCMLPVEWDGLDAAADAERTSRKRDYWVAQLKADGINAVYVDGVIVGGREGAPLECALHCQPGLARLERAWGCRMVFLGEYVADDGFNATLAEHRKGEGTGVFWIYDAIPFDAWATGRPYNVPIEQRLDGLRDLFLATETGLFVGLLDHWELDSGELRAKAAEIWAAGFEGIVAKRRGSGYVRGRSDDWRKVKQRHQAHCEVLDTVHKAGRLHTLIVRGPVTPSDDGPANMGKPLRITGGWTPEEAASIEFGMGERGSGRMVTVAFELTVGRTRTIRAPKYKGISA